MLNKIVYVCCTPNDISHYELIIKKFYRYKLPRGTESNYILESVIFKFADSSQLERGFNNDDVLLVFCSVDAVKVEHQKIFNDFIVTFKQRRLRIIPVIVNGEPNSLQNECFPDELKTKSDTDFDEEAPLALDIRLEKNIKDAILKLQASIFDIDYEILKQREKKRKLIRKLQLFILTLVILWMIYSAIFSILYPSIPKKISNKEINNTLTEVRQESIKQKQNSFNTSLMLTMRIGMLESVGEKDFSLLEAEFKGIIIELSKLESGTKEKIELISYAGDIFFKKFRWANSEYLYKLLVENIKLLPNQNESNRNLVYETSNKIALNQLALGKIQDSRKIFQYIKKMLTDKEYETLIRNGNSSLSKIFNENLFYYRDEKYLDWLNAFTLYSANILPKNINNFQLADELFHKSLVLDKYMKRKASEEFFKVGLGYWENGLETQAIVDKHLYTSIYNNISTYSTFSKNYTVLSKEITLLVKKHGE